MTSQRTRERMVERLRKEGVRDEVVLGVMASVPRHIFVDEALAHRAYETCRAVCCWGRPFRSHMPSPACRCCVPAGRSTRYEEIGTGCGYQTTVLSKLAREVYSIERIAPLLDKARQHLREMRTLNVRLRHGDGHAGIPEAAPFDAILLTCRGDPCATGFAAAIGGRRTHDSPSWHCRTISLVNRTSCRRFR